jgi:hypothetical protein
MVFILLYYVSQFKFLQLFFYEILNFLEVSNSEQFNLCQKSSKKFLLSEIFNDVYIA